MILISYCWLSPWLLCGYLVPHSFKVKMCFKRFSGFALIEDDQKVKCGVVDKCIIIHILGIILSPFE